MQTSKNPICLCPKCGEKAVFVTKNVCTKAGDNGHTSYDSYVCSKCSFAPFILPKIEGYDESSSN